MKEPTSGLEPLTCSLRVIIGALEGFARGCKPRLSKGFAFLRLACVAPYCAPGGVRVVSGSRGLRLASCCSRLAHASRYAALPDVAIAPDNLTAEQSLPRPAISSLYRMLDVDFREHAF